MSEKYFHSNLLQKTFNFLNFIKTAPQSTPKNIPILNLSTKILCASKKNALKINVGVQEGSNAECIKKHVNVESRNE